MTLWNGDKPVAVIQSKGLEQRSKKGEGEGEDAGSLGIS